MAAELRAEETDLGEGRRQSGVTLVTVYELPPARIDEFLPYWRERAESMSKAPGFRDDRLHRAVDAGTRFQLVGISHWDSPEAWRAAANDPRFQPSRLTALPDFAVADPALFRVAAEF
ncbi:Antibiotic biosynthesis monooxygenase [Streptomyces sp. YIM 130001]|nr:Antibiotic biosynthesis monooxygenase [Streptomyces sp. YIM 130001]